MKRYFLSVWRIVQRQPCLSCPGLFSPVIHRFHSRPTAWFNPALVSPRLDCHHTFLLVFFLLCSYLSSIITAKVSNFPHTQMRFCPFTALVSPFPGSLPCPYLAGVTPSASRYSWPLYVPLALEIHGSVPLLWNVKRWVSEPPARIWHT